MFSVETSSEPRLERRETDGRERPGGHKLVVTRNDLSPDSGVEGRLSKNSGPLTRGSGLGRN